MRIAFVLPIVSPAPVGGYRVVYEYANLLAGRGHIVHVAHTAYWDPPASLRDRLRRPARVRRMRRDRAAVVSWMELDPRVELSVVSDRRHLVLPAAEALIATSWVTAPPVAVAKAEAGFYLIQGYETWGADAEAVRDTWRLPLRKIVVSRWLRDIAVELGEGERTSYVPIGLDRDAWGVDRPPERREPRVGVAFSPIKDPADAIAALTVARERLPELASTGFGTGERPSGLPDWVEYVRRPDAHALRALYNSCSLFLQATGMEGWGLPAAEAMACGCALVTYDTGGSREYAEDGMTAVIASAREPRKLAAGIVELCRDSDRRLTLSRRGRERVSTYTWLSSVTRLEGVLAGHSGRGGSA